MAPVPVKQSPSTESGESLQERFGQLAQSWHKAVAHHSSSRIRDSHPAYKAIIRMGSPVVPFLLHDLEINRRHWFTALEIITGANPVAEDEAGDIPKMVAAWLRWGKDNG
jgi:hypothetical protein